MHHPSPCYEIDAKPSTIALPLPDERDRTKIDERFTWKLTDVYGTDEGWKKARSTWKLRMQEIEAFKGRLHESSTTLLTCLESIDLVGKEYARLYCYASMHADEDTRNAHYLGMEQEMSQAGSEFAAMVAFLQPELLAMEESKIESFLTGEPGLEIYRHAIGDILRRRDHTRPAGEERILAESTLMADSANSIYGIFSNADFPFPEVLLHNGRKIRLDKATFSLERAHPHREDRRKIFQANFSSLHAYRRTFGAQLYAEVKKNLFYARARRYPSVLHRALDAGNISTEVYHTLIRNVNEHLDIFHRYLKLRQRILGVEELHYYDLYAPLSPGEDPRYTFEEARDHVLASLHPLGDEYISVARRAFDERWIDVFPTEGKRAGAYSQGGAYDVHPYILLNYNGKYDDVSTLTHELGHTMHSYLTNSTQPYATSDYSIFVAEVASTFNEALLMNHMLKAVKDDRVRLSLLGNLLDGIRGTVFRQTQFAEFELAIHQQAERGESLTGDSLDAMYEEIVRKYYGHDRGVCIVDDEIRSEWANIPHFYYNFYVYQYATSFTASTALSEQVLAGEQGVKDRYLRLLRAGGSDYPIALLQSAGVDMTSSAPFALTMKRMNRVMDEMEEIISGHTP